MTVSIEFLKLVKILKRDLFPSLARKVFYENIRCLKISKKNRINYYVVYDNRNPPRIWQFTNRGFTVEETRNILMDTNLPKEEIRITDDFWTCECSVHFVHHKTETKCCICGGSLAEDTLCLRKVL